MIGTGRLAPTLLDIKHGRTPIERTLELAQALAAEVDERAHSARLPTQPDYEAADDFLRLCRREQARRQLLPAPTSSPGRCLETRGEFVLALFQPTWFPDPLPSDVDLGACAGFLSSVAPRRAP